MFTQLKKCDPCGKDNLSSSPWPKSSSCSDYGCHVTRRHMRGNPHPGLHLLLRGAEFSPQNWAALSQAVFVHTAEYIIRQNLRIPSHLFKGNSHFPLDPPVNAYAWHGKAEFADFSSRDRKSALLPQYGMFVHTSPCFYPHVAKQIRLKWVQKRQYMRPSVY